MYDILLNTEYGLIYYFNSDLLFRPFPFYSDNSNMEKGKFYTQTVAP